MLKTLQPISAKVEAKLRGPSSSEEVNQWMNQSHYDLVQLFNRANELGQIIPDNMKSLVLENIFLQKRLNELFALLENLQQNVSGNSRLLHNFYIADSLKNVLGYQVPEIDPDYGVLKVPANQEISKLYYVDTSGSNLIPRTLDCKLYESTSPIDISMQSIDLAAIDDYGLKNIFDGDWSSFWVRKSDQNTSVNEVYFCLEITLPMNIVNHSRGNALYLNPVPLESMTLLDVWYKGVGDWNRLSTYPVTEVNNDIEPKALEELGQIAFSFPTRDVLALRIYGKQANWIYENNNHSFYYGFRNIDLNYVSVKDGEFRARIQFTAPGVKSILSVSEASVILAEGSVLFPNQTNIYSSIENDPQSPVQIYKVYIGESGYNFGSTLPAGTHSVDLEIGIRAINDTSPLIRGITIKYQSA
jgi:hypothetical protein